ncbi:MAG: hypothetical protein UR88_C0008G0008 [Candidatus Nomurabacteria bacterium GW2011_GWA1_35_8]|uniref:Uncharacterized protein n=1 Tax=Candidatus Nomurabacteria bacterium GW2011_GWA1_35_8 TaxID=1618727 RepID=A0A0G0CXF5_9BACT|nr:MAG: hypothetical protein UR88_C0008G0008 [Candidatus Nomurabacteria bacterium GW2011_GWA1_35_8]
MEAQTKVCQNCKKDFTIESEDFKFYEKIKVPMPTWCPECRLVRKILWRNERALYKRQCNNCKKNIISVYNSDSLFNIYCHDCWWSDKWNPMIFGVDYDFNKSLFEQFLSLSKKIPVVSMFTGGNQINSDYCNFTANNRNCYLCFGGKNNEQVSYSNRTSMSKESFDLYNGTNMELCYESVQCEKCYRLSFGNQCENCSDSMFLYDCRNCQNCFSCTNLRNKTYYIFNKQHSKEAYLKKMKEFNAGNFQNLENLKLQFFDVYKKSIHKYAHLINSPSSTGDYLFNAKNCKNCFDISGSDSENSKYSYYSVFGVKDCYDNYGMSQAEKVYETLAIGFESNENSNYFFSYFIKGSNSIYYSASCFSSNNLFACIGLRSKQYCILNKQYTKEEYEELVPKIIKHMNDMPYIDGKGRIYRYGEFFPPELSPFCYNETVAQEYFPLTKEEALKQGYRWKDKEERNYNVDIKNEDIPNDIKEVDDSIINKVIECEHKGQCNEQCTEAFKIIPDELKFYQRMNLPLPNLCPNCRHYNRLKQRNPLKLWHRKCMKPNCLNEFETSYAPDRPEIIYCEKCYQQEVY